MSALKEYGTKWMKDNYIFAHDMLCDSRDFYISVEVNEQKYKTYERNEKSAKNILCSKHYDCS